MHQESLKLYLLITKLLRSTAVHADVKFSLEIMRCLSVKKYLTYELKSKIIDYGGCSVQNCAFYHPSATTLFLPNFDKIWAN